MKRKRLRKSLRVVRMDIELSIKPEIKAVVAGKELTELPDDLYIPPDALEVLLDSFSGPLIYFYI